MANRPVKRMDKSDRFISTASSLLEASTKVSCFVSDLLRIELSDLRAGQKFFKDKSQRMVSVLRGVTRKTAYSRCRFGQCPHGQFFRTMSIGQNTYMWKQDGSKGAPSESKTDAFTQAEVRKPRNLMRNCN